VALPRLQEVFHRDFAEISWAVLVFYLVSAVAQPVIGRVSDLVGRRRLFLTGLATVFAASLLAACCTDFGWLLVFRGVQAFGTSMIASVGLSIIRLTITEGQGKAVALVSVFLSGAAALGPAVGGFLIHGAGWQSIFLINLPFVAASFLLAFWSIPRDVKTERRAEPLFPFRKFLQSPLLLLTNAEFILVNVVYYAFFFGVPSYLQSVRHLDSFQVGLLMLGLGIASLVASPLAGRWVDRVGPRPAMLVSGALMVAACIGTVLLGPDSPLLLIAAVLTVMGVANGLNSVSLQMALFQSSPRSISGAASGLFLTSRYGGTILASILLSLVFPQEPSTDGLVVMSMVLTVVSLAYLGLAAVHRAPRLGEVS